MGQPRAARESAGGSYPTGTADPMNRSMQAWRAGRIQTPMIIALIFILITSVAGAAGLAWLTTRPEPAAVNQPLTKTLERVAN